MDVGTAYITFGTSIVRVNCVGALPGGDVCISTIPEDSLMEMSLCGDGELEYFILGQVFVHS